MKFFKLFFSRFVLVAFAIFIELAMIILSVTYWNEYSTLLRIVNVLLAFAIFFHLTKKDEIPELKIPWFITIMAFPLFGTVLYIMISNNKPTKKQIAYLQKSQLEYDENIPQTSAEKEIIADELGRFNGIEEYLSKTAHTHGFMNSDVHYFNSGETFYKDLLENLKKAKKFIFFEFFIIENGEMWNKIHELLVEKVKEGVEVKFLYDDMGTAGKMKTGYYKSMIKEGIDCKKFNTFIPVISGFHNNRDHRKIVVIDGTIGYTGGINLADEYINVKHPFGQWKDSAIRINGKAVSNLTFIFLQMFNISKESVEYKKYLNIDYSKCEDCEGYVHAFGCGPAPFYKELVAENNFINMINLARTSIYITTPYLIVDHALTNALRNAALRGVDVRIITPHIPDKKIVFGMTRDSYKSLMQVGVRIFEYTPGFIHAKQMLIDGVFAFVGTINMDYRSLVHHYECGAVLYKSPCITDIKSDFNELFDIGIEQTNENYKISKFTHIVNAVLAIFRPLF